MNYYYNPVRTIEGAGCVGQLPDVLTKMNLTQKKVLLLVWGETVLKHPAFATLLGRDSGFEVYPLVFQASNPTVAQLYETYQATRSFQPEAVIAVGGGSIMDVGKSLCCLYGKDIGNVDELRELIKNKAYGSPAARWIGIPTTAGTGSETTCWATIWDPERDAKRSVECHENYAWAALVDPELAAGMPMKLAVSSALDAVAHAVESYWAKGSNCVSRALALEAVRTIMDGMEDLLAGKSVAHDAMARGSMLAGLAFSNTKTTACHSISYPLTMHYHIPHGVAVSMLLAPVFTLNLPQIEDPKSLLAALGVKDADEFKARINGLLTRASIKSTLSQWGADKSDIEALVPLCITKGRADNNPVLLTNENIASILESIY